MKKVIFGSALLALCSVVGLAAPAQALVGLTDLVSATDTEVRSNVLAARTDAESTRQHDFETKRAQLQERMAQKREAITETLSGKRAERCEQKQVSLNQLLDTRAAAAQQHFEKFKAIQAKLEGFVAKKSLDVENTVALQVIMNEKQASAQAAIHTVQAVNFECQHTDALSPGGIVREQVTIAKNALKEYRVAIKDYAVAVKSAATTPRDTTAEETTR